MGAVLAALVTTSLLVHGARTTVPVFAGLQRGGVQARAHRADVGLRLLRHYSSRPVGSAIAQDPAAGTRVGRGSRVSVTLSAGPRPVAVPAVVGRDVGEARSELRGAGLGARVTEVSSPGTTAGTVVAQHPGPPRTAVPGSAVALDVAAAPRWRTITTLAGSGDGRSVPFRIRGTSWRALYRMSFDGTCSLVLVCFGPRAEALLLPAATRLDAWDLDRGTDRVRTIDSGPGIYQLRVAAGDDRARWSIAVQDFS